MRLVRLPNGTVVADAGARAVGRGAYVCPSAECVERALSRGRLGHAFRKPSEAGPNLAAAVRAAGQREARVRAAPASADAALLCGVSARGVDVIAVRA